MDDRFLAKSPRLDRIMLTEKIMGHPGRLLHMSKSTYAMNHNGNNVVYNANLFIKVGKKYEKVWFGDVDITLQTETLIGLAEQLKTSVYVVREMDGRFDNEVKPKIENAVQVFMYVETGKTGREIK